MAFWCRILMLHLQQTLSGSPSPPFFKGQWVKCSSPAHGPRPIGPRARAGPQAPGPRSQGPRPQARSQGPRPQARSQGPRPSERSPWCWHLGNIDGSGLSPNALRRYFRMTDSETLKSYAHVFGSVTSHQQTHSSLGRWASAHGPNGRWALGPGTWPMGHRPMCPSTQ